MSRGKKIAVFSILLLALLPTCFLGLAYYQLSNLRIEITSTSSQVVDWIHEILFLKSPSLTVTMSFTNPTISPVDVSDIVAQLYIEDKYVLETSISTLYVPAGETVRRELAFTVEEGLALVQEMRTSAETYSGEVKITISGAATAQLLFFKVRLPFHLARYYVTKEPHLVFSAAQWTDSAGSPIMHSPISSQTYIRVELGNPTRGQVITEPVTVKVMMMAPLGFDEPVTEETKQVTVRAASISTVPFAFTPAKYGFFHFEVFCGGRRVYISPNLAVP